GYIRTQSSAISTDFDSFYLLSLNYKFYLSFEKLNCRNYITGKVYINAMQCQSILQLTLVSSSVILFIYSLHVIVCRYDMIPIVLGAFKDDYESTLPPHSFIIADDYKSIRELIDCLLYLDKDGAAYAAYFTCTRLDCRRCGFMHRLNAGTVDLPKVNAAEFLDFQSLCFGRSLPALE
uniref:Fucosyltransferase n=1 Tax=Echinococcus canadensis TaxID=519352 RepID=A0A915EVM1_9CEST